MFAVHPFGITLPFLHVRWCSRNHVCFWHLQVGTGQWSGGGATPRNPQQEAKLFLMRTGNETNMQSDTRFFLTAVYTGTTAISKEGACVTGESCSCVMCDV